MAYIINLNFTLQFNIFQKKPLSQDKGFSII